jgi:hypothetical protein
MPSIDEINVYVFFAGVALTLIAVIWLICSALRYRWYTWGVISVLFPPASIFYGAVHWQRAWRPFLLFLVGFVVFSVPYVMTMYSWFIPKGPWIEVQTDGTEFITLTGADHPDYKMLMWRPNVVNLKMANADVGDETVKLLKWKVKLKSLDLSDAAITDDALATIAELPALEELKLTRTKITDEGFRRHLMNLDKLTFLNWDKTSVKKETIAEWKKRKPGRRAVPQIF